jgi:hypothetical protein
MPAVKVLKTPDFLFPRDSISEIKIKVQSYSAFGLTET